MGRAFGTVLLWMVGFGGFAADDFALITNGNFSMGGIPGNTSVSMFRIGMKEVSKGEWDGVYTWATNNEYVFSNPGSGKATNHPVQTVSWYDCLKWCNARSQKEGLSPCYYTYTTGLTVYKEGIVDLTSNFVNWSATGYRLPTEAEWEKAARGGLTNQTYAWDNYIGLQRANYVHLPYGYNPSHTNTGVPYTCPVSDYSDWTNGYGLYNVCGNVMEWCWDWYGAYPGPVTNPCGPDSGFQRIVRGGSWESDESRCGVAYRAISNPSGAHDGLGFRCVRRCGRLMPVNDFDGDGTSDLAVYYEPTGRWYIWSLSRGANLANGVEWGGSGMVPAPGDYDGDGAADMAIYNRTGGHWNIRSLAGAAIASNVAWGGSGLTPVWGDFDGDGRSDLAVFATNSGYWYIMSLTKGTLAWGVPWGWAGAVPVPGDYDGDGMSDLAVFDKSINAYWYIRSTDGGAVIAWAMPWGAPQWIPVPGDYDGDRIFDLAVINPADSNWYITTLNGTILKWARLWGWAGAVPVPGDYDGDGESDMAVYDENVTSNNWYIMSMNSNVLAWGVSWGGPGLMPVGYCQ